MLKLGVALAVLAALSCSSAKNDARGGAGVTSNTPSGAYVMPLSIELTSSVEGAEVRYTVDGTQPTATSPVLTSSLTIDETCELRAATFVDGAVSGTPSEFVYVARNIDGTSDLPLMVLDVYGTGVPTKEVTSRAAFLLMTPEGATSRLSSPATVASRAGIHLRGQTSSEFPQRGYKLELRDANDGDADHALLSLPAESDWVLHNPYVDKSLIRNALIYGLGPELGLVSPKFAFIELYVNTDDRPLEQDDYQGVYLLVESIKNSKNRLDLKQLTVQDTTPDTLTGGYILKFELDVAEQPTVPCQSANRNVPCWVDLELHDPKSPNPEQLAWISDHVQAFHNTLFGSNYADATQGYAAYIDVDSFVNYFILQELTRNLDAYIRSLYFYKGRDSKLAIGPLWDYNLMGGIGCCGNDPIEGFQHAVARNGEANGWLQRLITDPAFMTRVVARYRELRGMVLSDAALDARILALTAPLTNASSRHFARWPILSQRNITYFSTSTEDSWAGQVESLRTWLQRRAAWLDLQW